MYLDNATLELQIIDSDRKAKQVKSTKLPSTAISTINETNSNATSTSGDHIEQDDLPIDSSKSLEQEQINNSNEAQTTATTTVNVNTQNLNNNYTKVLSLPLNSTNIEEDRIELDEIKATSNKDVQNAISTMITPNHLPTTSPEVAVHRSNPNDSYSKKESNGLSSPLVNITTDRTALNSTKISNYNLNNFSTHSIVKDRSDYLIRGPLGSLTIPDATNKQPATAINHNYPPSATNLPLTEGSNVNLLSSPTLTLSDTRNIRQQQSIPGQIVNLNQELNLTNAASNNQNGGDSSLYNMISIHSKLGANSINLQPSQAQVQNEANLKTNVKCETELLLSPAKLGQ